MPKKRAKPFLISFGADSNLEQDVTGSPRLLQNALRGMKLNGGFAGINSGPVPTMSHPRGTVLYDAVYVASNEILSKEVGRKAVILITDGEDEGSKLSMKAAIASGAEVRRHHLRDSLPRRPAVLLADSDGIQLARAS